MPALLDADALRPVLAALGVNVTPTPSSWPVPDGLAAALAFSLVGAAENHAMAAQQAANDIGATTADDAARLTGETLGAAGCASELDALDLLRWRATCLSQALSYVDVGGPWGAVDPMMHAIVVTAEALAGLMTACHKMRDPSSGPADTHDAAEEWWAAIGSLGEVAHMSATQSSVDHEHDGCECDCDAPTATAPPGL
jgi:hypothetical protein